MKLETERWSVVVPDTYYEDVISDYYHNDDDIDYVIEQVGYDFQAALQWSLDAIDDDNWYEECLKKDEANEFFEAELDTCVSKIIVKTHWLDEPDTYVYSWDIAEYMRESITNLIQGDTNGNGAI